MLCAIEAGERGSRLALNVRFQRIRVEIRVFKAGRVRWSRGRGRIGLDRVISDMTSKPT